MKKNLKKVVLVLALLLPGVIKAQEFNVTAKADFVSDYIWRGAYQNSGFSVQPTLGLSYGNLSLSAWGSQSLTKTDGAQEFDINLSYTIGGLGITVTDYWWNGITMPYGDYKHDHHFEGTLAYNFGENFPLTLSWSTMFAGGDDNKDGDRAYSTYINASYNIACPAEITLVNLYFVHLLFHIYRLLSALRRFDKSVCFLPAPKHLTSKSRMAAGSLLSGSLPLEISPGKNVPYLQ